ncbi:MAG: carboxypeptidase-like regulatory domain-containing protein [Bacteroidetes bacterium]|nr:carboxypeptidase-like regulatory domain-containing protein [Bacteroidota bacterium]MBS1539657.1 carboxypeptidase-like regulatory domain-containing protein [Bacteroidota bacterium]
MMKSIVKVAVTNILILMSGILYGQTNSVTGTIIDKETGEPLPGVSVSVKGSSTAGDYTSPSGTFSINPPSYPVTLVFSFIGFATEEREVASPQDIRVEMLSSPTFLQEVVVSASRSEQRKLEAPVTIERIGAKEIANAPQVNYYDMIQGLRGVDVTVSSIGFTSVTTRGFNTSGNTNFLQIVDGMDNQAPGLNFPLGNVIGLNQLDVDNVELLSGASSVLYGSRGLNGAMLMKGKNPFQYQGLSVLYTQGMNHFANSGYNDPVPTSPYSDFSMRYAKKLSEKVAFKINFQYTRANDWVANNTTNKNGPGTSLTDPNYNGINMYGSATSTDITPFLQYALSQDPSLAPLISSLPQPYNVARTGYQEYGYLNNNIHLAKGNAELRYKISPKVEAIASGTFGTGSIVYTNDTRYQIRDYRVGQYRLELAAKNWFWRTYTTQENSGKTLIAGPTAQLINEAWKPSYNAGTGDGWYPQYTGALLNALANGADFTTANQQARAFADNGMPAIGSARFNHLKDSISQLPITQGGTLFLDRSKLYNSNFQYNFSDLIRFAEVIAGVNWRLYNLDSKGTLFPDQNKPIQVYEYSVYAQISKALFENRWKLSGSVRADKNTLFDAPKATSRLTSVYEVARDNYFRFSYQNAYSFPSNVQALQNTLNGYNSYSSGGSTYLLNSIYHFDQYQPYTLQSVQKYQQTGNTADLQPYVVHDIKPQSANSFEVGYAAVIKKNFYFDVLGYYTQWTNFIGYFNVANTYVVSTQTGTTNPSAFNSNSTYTVYNIAYNGGQRVYSFGYAASLGYNMEKNFATKVNFYSDHLRNGNSGQISYFNTPAYHINAEFANTGFGAQKAFSFSTTVRYKPAYYYQVMGGLGVGTVPASAVIDAQIGYRFSKAHTLLKIGGTNLTNQYYSTGIANPMIGAMYYVSVGYNVL